MSGRRTELEISAIDTVQRVGMQNLSFRTLADQVGVRSSSVHYYFPEKSDLASAMIQRYIGEFNEQLTRIDQRNATLRKKLEAFLGIFEKVIKADKFCLCGMMAAEVLVLNDDNRALLAEYFQQAEDWLKTVFKEHKKQLSSPLKPKALAKLLMSGLEGAILLDRVDGGSSRLSAQREFIRSIVR